MELKEVFDYAESSVSNIVKAAKTLQVDGMVSVALLESMYNELQRLHKEQLKK
jgi:hypothetical protein